MSRKTKRIVGSLVAGVILILMGGCGDYDQTLVGPEEHQLPSFSMPSVEEEDFLVWEESAVFVAIPEERYVSGICDSWISSVVVSTLPTAARESFAAKGLVFVDDEEIASTIANIAGIGSSYLSGGVWIVSSVSWSCVKGCFAEPHACDPCPACCEGKDGYVNVQFEEQ